MALTPRFDFLSTHLFVLANIFHISTLLPEMYMISLFLINNDSDKESLPILLLDVKRIWANQLTKIWDKVFKNRPSKIGGGRRLKKSKGIWYS